ncbi:SIS domain-containing protein [Candidatus Gottesmanbacteria bacterium]|nr:SIS domain-containing protein [Candidatus Gottesmanbacteria bacterium]
MDFEKFSSDKYFGLIAKSALHFIESHDYQKIVTILFECYKRGGTVFTMGCGGSASTATHFAADLAKTTMVGGKFGFKAISLVDNIPLVSAWINDKGWSSIFAGQLEQWITKDDVLVGFSVHGGTKQGDEAGPWSQNLVAAMKLAKERKAKIIGFCGFDGGAMKELADAAIIVPIHSEPYGTPAIEAMHIVLHHPIIYDLKERIKGLNGRKKTA